MVERALLARGAVVMTFLSILGVDIIGMWTAEFL